MPISESTKMAAKATCKATFSLAFMYMDFIVSNMMMAMGAHITSAM